MCSHGKSRGLSMESWRLAEFERSRLPPKWMDFNRFQGGLVPMLALSGVAAVYPESSRCITIQ